MLRVLVCSHSFRFYPLVGVSPCGWHCSLSCCQYRSKHVAVHYIVIKYTSCDTVLFDYIPFSKFHAHNGDDTLPRCYDLALRECDCFISHTKTSTVLRQIKL